MKKRILITAKNVDYGGIETSLLTFLNNLDTEQYDIDLYLQEKGALFEQLNKNISVYLIEGPNKGLVYRVKKNILVDTLYRKFSRQHQKEYDIAIAYYGFDNYPDLFAASSNANKKYIYIHNDLLGSIQDKKCSSLYLLKHRFMGRKWKYFDKVICVSEGCQESFCKLYPKQITKTMVIHNMIDQKEIVNKSNAKTDIILTGDFNIVAVGRLAPGKNYTALLQMHQHIIEKYPIKTYIVGSGEQEKTLRALIKKNHLEDSFILLGAQKNPYTIMKQADLLVSTSLYESFSIVLLEAAILGVPFISNINQGACSIKKHIIKNAIVVPIDKIESEIIAQIEQGKSTNHVVFDSEQYNRNIHRQIENILK